MLGGRKIMATLAGETMEGSVTRGCLQGAFYHLCCRTWLWMNSIIKAIIHWVMQMTLLSSSLENSQTVSHSFFRRL